jgi:hypothetical protein
MEYIIPTLTALTTLIPVFIVWLIGAILAISRWRRHPRVSLFVIIAFVVMMGATVIFRVVSMWAPMIMRDRDWSMGEFGAILTAINFVYALVNAAAWTLVLCAIFGWRANSEKQNLFPPAP